MIGLLKFGQTLKKMFQAWELGPKNKCPDSRSYQVVRDAVADDFTLVKMYFFSYVASLMEPFLRMYQSNKEKASPVVHPQPIIISLILAHHYASVLKKLPSSEVSIMP